MARSGIVVLDKPPGMSSRKALDRVARLVRPDKAGHAGTLDPLATGVLVALVGQATRLTYAIHALSKVYRAEFLLGQSSDTDDVEGTITEHPDDARPDRAALEAALPDFVGRVRQRPPAHSAIKIEGRRAYARARAGETVVVPERTVVIHEATIDDFDAVAGRLIMTIHCGTGTYIRAIGRDLAAAVGTHAVMSALDRVSIGPWTKADAVPTDDLTLDQIDASLRPLHEAVAHLPQMTVSDDEAARLRVGQVIAFRNDLRQFPVAAMDDGGGLVALVQRAGGDHLRPLKVFGDRLS